MGATVVRKALAVGQLSFYTRKHTLKRNHLHVITVRKDIGRDPA
jgi:hypothetical protein